jgi:hypothetical protein
LVAQVAAPAHRIGLVEFHKIVRRVKSMQGQ